MTELLDQASGTGFRRTAVDPGQGAYLGYHATRQLMRAKRLHTVCEEAACPNIGECWAQGHATVMILGDTCTRACSFVKTGLPKGVDPNEPEHLAEALRELGLEHIVITSVDRDDLPDGGAFQFAPLHPGDPGDLAGDHDPGADPGFPAQARRSSRSWTPGRTSTTTISRPCRASIAPVRPGALISIPCGCSTASERSPGMFTKSGIMVGLGEEKREIYQVMDDMRSAGSTSSRSVSTCSRRRATTR